VSEQLKARIKRWVRPEIQALAAYPVADASGLIKLDAMENPYVWPHDLKQAWLQRLQQVDVNRYPDPQADELKISLRHYMGLADEQMLLLGNGSDELIQMLAMTLGGPGRSLLSVEPGFVMYRMIALFTGTEYRAVTLNADDFSLNLAALLEQIERSQPAIIFLAYPNNPTGNLFERDHIEQIIQAADGVVVVDEAYAPFTDDSFLADIERYDNLLVMRTLSKMGLAGLRLGMLAGSAQWLQQIEKTRLPYNINILSQVSVRFALQHQAVFDEQTRTIRQQRELMLQGLAQHKNLTLFPSQANFILMRLAAGKATEIHQQLKQQGILVKLLHGSHPLLQDCIRVTVGSEEQNQRFESVLVSLL